uniref:Uncharacterized protein n=1 Tax=Avena sativa TaxID=4498 RepID=A0ACD5VB72_AVESA
MGGASLAIVEKKPPFGSGGGCAGGVLFHLLDWHRRLARKRRLFSPRRLLPSAARSSASSPTRRLPPPPSSPAPPPLPATSKADGPAAAPGVVARLMGLDSWPGAPPAAPRPQKQRKVEPAPVPAPAIGGEDAVSEVVVMLPPSRHPHPHARNHHSADLPARSPRRTRVVHAAAARLLEPAGARGGSRARLAYACSSPQHRGHAGGKLQDFLSRSDSQYAPPADTDQDNAVSARWQHTQHTIEIITATPAAAAATGIVMSDTIVVPRLDSGDANTITGSSEYLDALPKDTRERTGRTGSGAVARSSNAGAGARTGEQRPLRKRGTFSRPDVPRGVASEHSASSTLSTGNARELSPGGSSRRAAHNSGPRRKESTSSITAHNSGPRRESTTSITLQRSNRRDVIDRNGSASTSRNASNASGPRRGPRKKIDRGTAGSNYREDHNAVTFASSSCSTRPVSRASPLGKDSEKRRFHSVQSDASCVRRMPVVETSPSSVALSEKEEFSRLLKAKINELGLADKVEPSDAHSANLTASLLQELIAALNTDTNTSASQSSNYSDSSALLNNADTVCNSSEQSPEFHKRYQFQGDQEADFSVACTNDEPNQPSPTSVLEACFSNDASSSGSPVQKDGMWR